MISLLNKTLSFKQKISNTLKDNFTFLVIASVLTGAAILAVMVIATELMLKLISGI